MAEPIPGKSYFRIGEVSKILGVAPYVIRYWESEFKTVKPIRAKSDQRLYRRKDVEELLMIKSLLYDEKFTIIGAKKRLAELRDKDTDQDPTQRKLVTIKRGLLDIKKHLNRQ